ncbi:hypothetical protein H4S08_003314 [Coemansia sp. RSA 1365]|nr:hypothetical protein H4S08_003314 [Coemansia sp. RSA 1365]
MSPKTQGQRPQKPDAPVAQPAQTEATRLAYVLMIATAVRLTAFVLFPGLVSTYLSGRVELSTPVTSYKRLVEGLHLSAHGVSPYDGGVFHQSPLLLLLFKPLYYLPSIFTDMLYTTADVLVALMLAKLAALKANSALNLSVPGETRLVCMPSVVAMLYLFNPLTMGTTLVKSTIVFSHLAVVSSLYFGLQGRTNRAIACAAAAAHLSLYPAMLIVPISLMADNCQQRCGSIMTTVVKFIMAVGLLHVLFVAVFGSEYFGATFDFTVRVADLQPNVGLFWYFFTEVFDEFRLFFYVVFQLTALGFAVPVSWRFRHDPLFAATFLVGIISALKSYPAWGDLALFLGLLPIFEELLKYLQYIFLSANLLLYGIALAPVFWYLWIEQGSGNANFFYAATLVYVFGQITLLFDLGTAKLRRDLDIQRPEMRTRTVIQE